MKTFSAKPREIGRHWFVVDASDQVLGRLATKIATIIRGKHKPAFTPSMDVGDFVIVVNAEKVKLTGAKLDNKLFRRHTGYPGGLVEIPYRRLLETHPERAIEQAVWGMLPKGRLGRTLRHKLKVYKGPNHPHASQKPEVLDVWGQIPVYLTPEPPPGPRKKKPKRAKAAGDATAEAKTPSSKAGGKSSPKSSKSKPATRKKTGPRKKKEES